MIFIVIIPLKSSNKCKKGPAYNRKVFFIIKMFYFYPNLSINSAPILYYIKQLRKHIINDRKIIVAIVKYKHKFFRLNPICQ